MARQKMKKKRKLKKKRKRKERKKKRKKKEKEFVSAMPSCLVWLCVSLCFEVYHMLLG